MLDGMVDDVDWLEMWSVEGVPDDDEGTARLLSTPLQYQLNYSSKIIDNGL